MTMSSINPKVSVHKHMSVGTTSKGRVLKISIEGALNNENSWFQPFFDFPAEIIWIAVYSLLLYIGYSLLTYFFPAKDIDTNLHSKGSGGFRRPAPEDLMPVSLGITETWDQGMKGWFVFVNPPHIMGNPIPSC